MMTKRYRRTIKRILVFFSAAVVLNGQASRALVDECMMQVGHQVDGFTLISIESDQVVFATEQRRCVLRLATAPGP